MPNLRHSPRDTGRRHAEICHIKPLGRPHNGPDVPENILCLCPNCHVLLDEYSLWIDDDHKVGGSHGHDFLRIPTVSPQNVWSLIAASARLALWRQANSRLYQEPQIESPLYATIVLKENVTTPKPALEVDEFSDVRNPLTPGAQDLSSSRINTHSRAVPSLTPPLVA